MLVSPFLSVRQDEIVTKLEHQAYKISVTKKNERDSLELECQFLFRYLTCGEDIRNPQGHTIHWIEQELGIHMEQVMCALPS